MADSDIKKEYGHKDIVWAIFLVFIGLVFLLNTTGVVDWSIWTYILRFWPVFLILAGIKLMIGQSVVGEIVLSVIAVVVFLFIGMLAYMVDLGRALPFMPNFVNSCVTGECGLFLSGSGDIVEEDLVVVNEDFSNVESRLLELKVGAASFRVEDENTDNFVNINTKYTEGMFDPTLNSSLDNGILNLRFDSVNTPTMHIVRFNNTAEFLFRLGQPLLDTDLKIDLGAGEGIVTLSNSRLVNVDTSVGAGKLTLDLRNESIPTGEMDVDVGAGEIELILPEDVGYEMTYSLGIGEISVNGEEIATFAGNGEDVRSANYDTATKIVKINANVGVGSLQIKSK